MNNAPSDDYFALRGVEHDFYEDYEMPFYLRSRLPPDKSSLIIDFGCGFGQMLRSFRNLGYKNVVGVEINDQAVEQCLLDGFRVVRSLEEIERGEVRFVLMSHVLEHLPKAEMRDVLTKIKSSLSVGGYLLICVPNAQSSTGAYWAYEDFTHEYLFTSGSLKYVARLAGFSQVSFIDTDCTEGLNPFKKVVRRVLLSAYTLQYKFWNKVTGSHPHYASENIFSYELKAVCR